MNKLFDLLLRAAGLEQCDIIFEGGTMDGEWIDSVIEVVFAFAKFLDIGLMLAKRITA